MKQIKFILLVLITNLFVTIPALAVENNRNVRSNANCESPVQLKTEYKHKVKAQKALQKNKKRGKIRRIIMWSIFVISIICIIIGLAAELLPLTITGFILMLIPIMMAGLD